MAEDIGSDPGREWQEIFEAIGHSVLILDPDAWIILDANRATVELTGLSRDQLIGRHCYEIFHGTATAPQTCPMRMLRQRAPGEADDTQRMDMEALGGVFQVSVASTRGGPGQTRVIHVAVDITQSVRAQEQVRRDQVFLNAMFDSIQEGISVLSPELTVLRVNQVMNQWYASNLPLTGRKCYEVYHDADRPCDPCPSLRCLRSGKVERNLVPGLPGSPVEWIELFSYPMRDPDSGETTGVIEFVRDVTEVRRMEQEKEEMRTQLSQAQKMEAVGRLAGGVAHDFNNMLGVIKGYADLLLRSLDQEDPARADVGEILQATDRAAQITRQLLAFTRQQIISPRVLDLNEVLAASEKMLRTLVGEDISVRVLPGRDLWPVEMDPVQIDQILFNLAANSRDAIRGAGQIVIETSNRTLDSAYCAAHPGARCGDFVLLCFTDDGSGMDRDTLARIFEPFFTTKGPGVGTGLGMATVYGIVKQNDGYIRVYSEPDEGTAVKIYLPRSRGESCRTAPADTSAPPRAGAETVLVVEDTDQILSLCRRALEREGYTVLTAATPEDALSLVRETDAPVDLLLTDVVLPQMNGRQLREQIQVLRPGLKALYMSGYTSNVIVRRGILDPQANFLEKPFSPDQLARAVRRTLDASPAPRPPDA